MSEGISRPDYLARKLLSTELPWVHPAERTEAGYIEMPTRLDTIARELADIFFDPASNDNDFQEPEARLRRDYETFLAELNVVKRTGRGDSDILARGGNILQMMLDHANATVEECRKGLRPDEDFAAKIGVNTGRVSQAYYEMLITKTNAIKAIESMQCGLQEISRALQHQRQSFRG